MTADDIVRAFDPTRLRKPPSPELVRTIAEVLVQHGEITLGKLESIVGADEKERPYRLAIFDVLANKRDGVGTWALDVYHCDERIERRDWADGFPHEFTCPKCGSTDVRTLRFDIALLLRKDPTT